MKELSYWFHNIPTLRVNMDFPHLFYLFLILCEGEIPTFEIILPTCVFIDPGPPGQVISRKGGEESVFSKCGLQTSNVSIF